MNTTSSYEYRLVRKDGELAQQSRIVETTVSAKKWWKPWQYTVERVYGEWYDYPIPTIHTFRVGDRVKVISGFNVGAMGEINFIEPRGRCWVTRDNSGGPVYYKKDELELIWRRPNE